MWPAQAPVPPLVVPACVGMVEDHIVVKEGDCEGVLAKLLSLGIITWTAGCFVQSLGALLLICQHAHGLLTVGRIHARAAPHVGRVGPDSVIFFVENRNGFSFFISELNFDN